MPSSRRSSQGAAAAAAATNPDATAVKGKDNATSTTASSSAKATSTTATASAEAGPSTFNTTAKPAPSTKEEASTDAHLELLTEHFGYNPKSFIDALVYLSNEHLYSIATEFESVVSDLLKDVDGGELEAEQGIHAILTLMENALDHTLDTFELYCFRSVFGIRSRQARYMTLDHHRELDLRSSSKAQGKGSRKGGLTSAANEKSYQLGETEDSLKRQIAAARATQHKLLLAQNATQESLNRMLDLAERFSSILYAEPSTSSRTTAPVLTETLGQHARKIKADTIPLLKALNELRSTDPLGAPLYSSSKSAGDAEAEDDNAAADVRVWERGREPYLNWEVDRILAKSKRGATGAAAAGSSTSAEKEGGLEEEASAVAAVEDDSKTPKRKRTLAGSQPASSKRRTPGTAGRSRG